MGDLKEFLKSKKLLNKYNEECKEFEIKKNKMTEKIDLDNIFTVLTEIRQTASKMFTFECVYKLEQLANDGIEFIDLAKDYDLGIFNYSIEPDGIQLKKGDKFNSNIPFDLFLKDANDLNFLNENSVINILELQKYFYRIIEKGNYKSDYHKAKVFKKILNIDDKKHSKTDLMVVNKEILNHDFSIRQSLILDVMGEYGDNKNKVIKEKNNIKLTKIGLPCNSSEKALYDYLLGQFVENGYSETKILLNEELLKGLGVSNGRGDRFKPIKDAISTISTQFIRIDDAKANDKATRQIRKAISETGRNNIKERGAHLIDAQFIEVEGELAIKFTIPLIKMFCSHKQYARILLGDAIKHWKQNPRIYWISKELSALSRNKRNNRLKVETLLKNIGEWERYKNYSDKRKFLNRFNKDFEIAKSYVKTDKEFIYNGCSPSTLKETRIICM